jgi:hypothetical protein
LFTGILISIFLALLVALFQYRAWNKSSVIFWLLTFFRTISIAILILLLFNLSIDQIKKQKVKPNLILMVDNSKSIEHLNKSDQLKKIYKSIISNNELQNKFTINSFSFGKELKPLDCLDFKSKQSNINKSIKSIFNIYKSEVAPIILISDGNQTFGENYLNKYDIPFNQLVYPIVVGDTIVNEDLKISKINTNKYTFIENEFPVEVFVNYNGNKLIESELVIENKGKRIIYEKITLSASKRASSYTFYLKTNTKGLNTFEIKLKPIDGEKLILNNNKKFAIEALNEKIDVAFVSELSHPDLGTFSTILRNKKKFNLYHLRPNDFVENPAKYEMALIYQPNNNFGKVFESLKKHGINNLIISSTQTDIRFLNKVQELFTQDLVNLTDESQAYLSNIAGDISLENIDFNNYPPIKSNLGRIKFSSSYNLILKKIINGVKTDQPLLISADNNGLRQVVFFGEDIWKWRMYCFKRNLNFSKFDSFFYSLFQYLSTKERSEQIKSIHELIFDGTMPIEIYAKLYDDNFKENFSRKLKIEIYSETNNTLTYDMNIVNGIYLINLDNLDPGLYTYKILSPDNSTSKKGEFEILSSNIETRFFSSNHQYLKEIAKAYETQCYSYDNYKNLIDHLLVNDIYNTVDKLEKKSLPLINLRYLLAILLLSLTIEWFLRKYNGLT